MSVERIIELERWTSQLLAELPLSGVIDEVTTRMQTADSEDYSDLVRILAGLLIDAGRPQEVLELVNKMIVQLPNDVRFPIQKATLYLYFLNDLEEALKCIDSALQRAYRTGFFRREALGVKARILLQLGNGEQLSRVLEEIMSLQVTDGIPDIGRERDFVDRAPPGLIPEYVLARYNAFRPKK